jgi:8-oxo-dGTP pyrophosphatase MutT (NUDIX family)
MATIPVDAATAILLRPCPEAGIKDIEVLLVRRNRQSSFVPGYYVFPGGVLDPEDYEPGIERFIRGIDGKQAGRIITDMSHPAKTLGAWFAAIRETFEEVGVLIARKKDGAFVTIRTQEERRRFLNYRRALGKGEIKFSQILEAEGIFLAGDCLHYFSHWITPEPLPLRYDVRFFLAEAPSGQAVVCDGIELTEHIWLRPSAALADYEAGRIGMVLPQIMTLVELSRFRTVAETIASSGQRNIAANLTRIRNIDGHDVEVMPDGTFWEIRPPVYVWPENKK